MYVNIRDMVIKYSLIFVCIFLTLFVASTHLSIMINMDIVFGLLHFVALFILSVLVFFSFLFFKLLKFNLSLLKLMQLQAQIEDIRQQLQTRQAKDEEFINKLNEINNKKK